jgi:poly(3-hydroxybutyrate) depolymerase
MPAVKKIVVCLCLLNCAFANCAQSQENTVRPQGIYSSNFVIDGIPRTINFYIPLHYGGNNNYPVVFFLHAEGETGKSIIKKYGETLHRLADKSSCIVVYPDAVGGHWNTKLDDHAAADTINDAGFINIMSGYFIQQYQGDAARIYAAGFYNGGSMALRLSCTAANKITAIAPFMANPQAAQKGCAPGIYFNAEKFMPPLGKKFTTEGIEAAWKFLMGQKTP